MRRRGGILVLGLILGGCGGGDKPLVDDASTRADAHQACRSFLMIEGLSDGKPGEPTPKVQDLENQARAASAARRYGKLSAAVHAYAITPRGPDAIPTALRERVARVGVSGLSKAELDELTSYTKPATDTLLALMSECRALGFADPSDSHS